MADKIPVIVDNRGDNTVLQAPQKPFKTMDIATGVFRIGSFLLLKRLWRNLREIRTHTGLLPLPRIRE